MKKINFLKFSAAFALTLIFSNCQESAIEETKITKEANEYSERELRKRVIAGLDWNDYTNNRGYLFGRNKQYIRYNKFLEIAESGYPQPTNDASWPGLGKYRQLVSAAFKWHNDKGYFFLKDGTYLRYDMNTDRVDDGYPYTVTNGNWPGLAKYSKDIVAAFKWDDSKAYFFLKDGTYLRYSITNDRVDDDYPLAISDHTWPGLGNYARQISAALDLSSKYCYFFLKDNTYIKYNKHTDSAEPSYPKPIDNAAWPGLRN